MKRNLGNAHQAIFLVVAYDVCDPRRLRRVAKVMEQYGARVQRSTFECRLDKERIDSLLAEIKSVIKGRQDKVTLIALCEACAGRSERFIESGLTTDADIYIC